MICQKICTTMNFLENKHLVTTHTLKLCVQLGQEIHSEYFSNQWLWEPAGQSQDISQQYQHVRVKQTWEYKTKGI